MYDFSFLLLLTTLNELVYVVAAGWIHGGWSSDFLVEMITHTSNINMLQRAFAMVIWKGGSAASLPALLLSELDESFAAAVHI